jgi:hypothetical protein
MGKFPVDAPKVRVMTALRRLGFEVVREGNHISVLNQAGINRGEFLDAYEQS